MAESNNQVVRWNEEHQRSYVLQYANGQWNFLRWLDRPRADSFVRPPPPPSRGEGLPIEGTYTAANPQSFETLDQSFYVRPSSFFQEGRVFAVLFTEPAGQNAKPTDYNTSFSYVKFQELVYSQIRRFIVVSQRREFCFAVPIFTYSNQGTLKHGVRPEEHAIAYSYGCQPSLLQGEVQLPKHPICVIMNQGEPALSIASRIYFAIHHPIQYNVKVKNLGSVHPDDVPRLRGYWSMENDDLSNQPVT